MDEPEEPSASRALAPYVPPTGWRHCLDCGFWFDPEDMARNPGKNGRVYIQRRCQGCFAARRRQSRRAYEASATGAAARASHYAAHRDAIMRRQKWHRARLTAAQKKRRNAANAARQRVCYARLHGGRQSPDDPWTRLRLDTLARLYCEEEMLEVGDDPWAAILPVQEMAQSHRATMALLVTRHLRVIPDGSLATLLGYESPRRLRQGLTRLRRSRKRLDQDQRWATMRRVSARYLARFPNKERQRREDRARQQQVLFAWQSRAPRLPRGDRVLSVRVA